MVAEAVSNGYPSQRPATRTDLKSLRAHRCGWRRASSYWFEDAADRSVASRLALNSAPGFHSGIMSLFATR
jgi:hypothetical protein